MCYALTDLDGSISVYECKGVTHQRGLSLETKFVCQLLMCLYVEPVVCDFSIKTFFLLSSWFQLHTLFLSHKWVGESIHSKIVPEDLGFTFSQKWVVLREKTKQDFFQRACPGSARYIPHAKLPWWKQMPHLGPQKRKKVDYRNERTDPDADECQKRPFCMEAHTAECLKCVYSIEWITLHC